MPEFKISLAAARVNAGLTQKEAAEKLEINIGTMQNWENGKTTPNAENFIKLCKLYNCPVNAISLG